MDSGEMDDMFDEDTSACSSWAVKAMRIMVMIGCVILILWDIYTAIYRESYGQVAAASYGIIINLTGVIGAYKKNYKLLVFVSTCITGYCYKKNLTLALR